MKEQNKSHQQKMKISIVKALTIVVLNLVFTSHLNAQVNVERSDIDILNNTKWQGTLMYIDYSSGKETILQTKMELTIKGNKIYMSTQYNDEPNANSKGVIKLKKGGAYLGKEKVIEKSRTEDNILKIVTTFDGYDNGKKAIIYKTYLFNEKAYSVTKEVQLNGSKEKFVRNKYNYIKI